MEASRRPVLVAGALLILAGGAQAQATASVNPTYDAVVEGMNCRQQATGRLDCTYKVGQSVQFSIAGVGQEDAIISFGRVDSTGGFVAGFAPVHGCVVIKPAASGDSAAALAFVSPRDGRVYRVWQHCKQPPRR